MRKELTKSALLIVTAIACTGIGLSCQAKSAQTPSIDVPSQPLINSNKEGGKALQQLFENVKAIGPYRFDGVLTTQTPKKLSVDTGTFFFMPSAQMRIEVLGKGYKSGTILVKDKSGTIKAKGGRALLGMKMTLEPDSNMLTLANGLNIVNCDLSSLLIWLQKQVSSGHKVYSSDTPLQVGSMATKVYVLEARDPSGSLSHRILVDPVLKVPTEWYIFHDGKFFSAVKFANFQVIPSMDESLFKL